MVERGEVVVVELDLGPLHHPVAEADEDVLDLPLGAEQRVLGARPGPAGRPGSVTSIASSARRVPSSLASSSALRDSSSDSSSWRASLPDLPTGPRSSAGRSEMPAKDLGEVGLPPQVADAQLLELGGRRGSADRLGRLLPDLLDALSPHGLPPDAIRCSAMAAAAATFRDSALSRTGIVTWTSHGSTTSAAGRPFPLRAEAESRRARRARRATRRRAPPARPGAPASLRCPRAPAARRRRHPCWPGRRALRTGRRSQGRGRRCRRPGAFAVRITVPTLPGSEIAVQVDAWRHGRLGPRLPPDADHPRPRAELRDPRQQRRLDLGPAEALTRRGEQLHRLRSGLTRRGQQVLALGDEQALALAGAPPAEAADQLELLVVGAGDHSIGSSKTKKGGRSADRPGSLALAALS